MKEMVRCKPCGFIMEAGKYDTCPACGVSSKVFEPYKDRVSHKRRQLLDLDLHPIAVHFPQTIAVFIFQFMLINIIFPHYKSDEILNFVQFLGILLPLAVFGAFVSGVIDAKIRFKKLSPSALQKKMYWGTAMFLTSMAVPIFIVFFDKTLAIKLIILLSTGLTLGIATILALMCKKLMYAEMPG